MIQLLILCGFALLEDVSVLVCSSACDSPSVQAADLTSTTYLVHHEEKVKIQTQQPL